jgi:hypothetical protein
LIVQSQAPTNVESARPITGTTSPAPSELFAEWRECARRGDFSRTWQISDRALELHRSGSLRGFPRHFQAVWDGSPVEGRNVLVRCNHGLGDTIQFSRFVPRLSAIAASVAVSVQTPLIKLLSAVCEGADLFPSDVVQHHDYDVEIEIMELAHLFRIELHDVATPFPYITAEPTQIDSDPSLKVGVVWRAGDWDDRRSIPFDSILPWTQVPGVQLFSLQQNPANAGWKDERVTILDASSLEKTARLMDSLDLIITVHLAGALGRPVWTLLQADADWRWMQGRPDSPWYPTMRLFRQWTQGDWTPVVTSVATELRHSNQT